MDPNIKAEIVKKVSNFRMNRPLKDKESAIRHYTMYTFNDQDDCIKSMFQAHPNVDNNRRRRSSTSRPSQPPSGRANFNATFISKEGLRECQLCGRQYKNRLHRNLFYGKLTCCVCNSPFENLTSLIEHADQTLKKNICCKAGCNVGLSDDLKAKEYHFKQHKKGNFCVDTLYELEPLFSQI